MHNPFSRSGICLGSGKNFVWAMSLRTPRCRNLILGREIGWGEGVQHHSVTLIKLLTLTFKSCLGFICKTVWCKKLRLDRHIGWGCQCLVSWCDCDFSFDPSVVTLI